MSKAAKKSAPAPSNAASQDVAMVTTWKVACDGGEGPLGHPRVWLSIPQDTGEITCGYCDKIFRIDRDHAGDDH